MKIFIEREIDLKFIVEDDFGCYEDDILQATIDDILESIRLIEGIQDIAFITEDSKKALLKEYKKIARQLVGDVQISLFD